MDANAQDRILFFDGCRGLLALSIFTLHFGNFLGMRPLLPSAYLAVDLFFLISGFVIARSFEPRFRAGLSTKAFLLLRLRRLYPLFLLGLTISAFAELSAQAARGGGARDEIRVLVHYLEALVGIPQFSGGYLYPVNPVVWSLALEIVANLVHALLLARLPLATLGAIATMAAAGLGWVAFVHDGLDVGYGADTALGGLARIGFAYTTGVVLARLQVPALPGGAVPAAVAVVALLVATLAAAPAPDLRAAFDWSAAVLVLPTLTLIGSRITIRGAFARPARVVGRLSYPLYVLHAPVFLVLHAAVTRMAAGRPFAQEAAAVATLLATLAVAGLASRLEPGRPLREAGTDVGR